MNSVERFLQVVIFFNKSRGRRSNPLCPGTNKSDVVAFLEVDNLSADPFQCGDVLISIIPGSLEVAC